MVTHNSKSDLPLQQDGSSGGTFQDKNDDFARIVSVTAHFCQFSPGWNQSGILEWAEIRNHYGIM